MKKIDYKKEIKRALEDKPPYHRDSGMFLNTPEIILYCQSNLEDLTSKAEIYEILMAYAENKKPNYEGILLPTFQIEKIIKMAKEYINMALEREKIFDKVSKLLGVDKNHIRQRPEDEFLVSLSADDLDKRIEGFEERAKEYIKNLNLPKEVDVLEIIPAELLPPLSERDFEECERLKECYVRKTNEEIERDLKEAERLEEEKGVLSLGLKSPYKMVKYVGINLIIRVKGLKRQKG